MPVKVLEIISVGYVAGGAENTIVKINPYLSNKGYILKTLASDLGPGKSHFNEFAFKNINTLGPLKIFFSLFNPFSFFALKKVLKKYQPDIIHLHTMHQITPSALFLLKEYPTVITLHGPEAFISKLLIWCLKPSNFKHNTYDDTDLNVMGKLTHFYFNYIQKYLYKWAFKNVDIFLAPSEYIQSMAQTDVSPIIHLPGFIELRKFHELKNNYNLLFVGRLEKIKGVEFFIQALVGIIKEFPQTTVTIIGDGSDKTELFNLTKSLGLEKHVQFMGWVENKDLDPYYEKASIVVVPSICPENFPTVCTEAMSVGRPVIGTKLGGIPEIIDDGVNGYLVEPGNPQQIAEKVIKLFSEEKKLEELGRNARKKAECFSIENHVDNLVKVYEEVMKWHKPKG